MSSKYVPPLFNAMVEMDAASFDKDKGVEYLTGAIAPLFPGQETLDDVLAKNPGKRVQVQVLVVEPSNLGPLRAV